MYSRGMHKKKGVNREKLLHPADRGRKGGKASLLTMSAEQRRRRARRAALVRWKKTSRIQRSEELRRVVLARWEKTHEK